MQSERAAHRRLFFWGRTAGWIWLPTSIVLTASSGGGLGYFFLLYVGGLLATVSAFSFLLFGTYWGPDREDLLEAFATGRKDINEYDPPPWLHSRRQEVDGRHTNMSSSKNGSVGAGIFWMFLLSLALFWLPLAGPLLAGIVGGKMSGGVGNAIAAVFLPGLIFAALLFAAATSLSGMPLLGAVAGAGGLVLSLVHIGPLLVGAIIGGLIA